MARKVWFIRECEPCFGSGLDPGDVEDICGTCRGYGEIPDKLEGLGLLAIPEWMQWGTDLFRTRREAIAAIDAWYVSRK
jgi:hypothetical protein